MDALDRRVLPVAVVAIQHKVKVNVGLCVQDALVFLVQADPRLGAPRHPQLENGAVDALVCVLHETLVAAVHPVCSRGAVSVADVDALKVLDKVSQRHPKETVCRLQSWVEFRLDFIAVEEERERERERRRRRKREARGRKREKVLEQS